MMVDLEPLLPIY